MSSTSQPPRRDIVPLRRSTWYTRWGKRAFDIVGSLALGVVLTPIIAIAGVLIAWRLGRPVLFRQARSGKQGVNFQVLKFRTMTDDVDEHGNLLPDEQRLTPFGKFLRASSIDEFPQLWNVLRGDMSLVGPRPLVARYLDYYTPDQRRRLEVSPGVTGQAQVKGRNSLSWEEKFAHDIWYVEHVSLWVDLKILAQTVVGVALRVGIAPEGQATPAAFTGTSPTEAATATKDQAAKKQAA
ncbi:MAG: sugar transferase [Planctomycetales bacterium]|nr:sugar transferase [Planctomycetales bacterium]